MLMHKIAYILGIWDSLVNIKWAEIHAQKTQLALEG